MFIRFPGTSRVYSELPLWMLTSAPTSHPLPPLHPLGTTVPSHPGGTVTK